MKIGSNRDINKDHKKLPPPEPNKAEGVSHAALKMRLMKSTGKPVKDHLAVQYDNPKILTEKHNDEKLIITLLIVGAGFHCLSFLVSLNNLCLALFCDSS